MEIVMKKLYAKPYLFTRRAAIVMIVMEHGWVYEFGGGWTSKAGRVMMYSDVVAYLKDAIKKAKEGKVVSFCPPPF